MLNLAAAAFVAGAVVTSGMTVQTALSLVISVGGLLCFFAKIQYLTVERFEKNRFWLRGCGQPFLLYCRNEFGGVKAAESADDSHREV